jgi:hypothetical protein
VVFVHAHAEAGRRSPSAFGLGRLDCATDLGLMLEVDMRDASWGCCSGVEECGLGLGIRRRSLFCSS